MWSQEGGHFQASGPDGVREHRRGESPDHGVRDLVSPGLNHGQTTCLLGPHLFTCAVIGLDHLRGPPSLTRSHGNLSSNALIPGRLRVKIGAFGAKQE